MGIARPPFRIKQKIITMAKTLGSGALSQDYNRHVSKLCQLQQLGEALHVVEFMGQHEIRTSIKTYACLLQACATTKALMEGKRVHAHIITDRLDFNIYLANTLIDMYANCGDVPEAQRVFDNVPHHNVFSWTAIISAYVKKDQFEHALHLFDEMKQQGMLPDKVLFIVILKICASIAILKKAKQIHSEIVASGFELDVFVGNTLVDMYAKCGSIKDACHVFRKMCERNVVSWNAIIAGCADQGYRKHAFSFFKEMQKEGVKPDSITFLSILKVCTRLSAVQWGKLIHAHIIQTGFELNMPLGNALIDMYAKCGSIEDSLRVFNKMSEQNVVTWTAIIAGFAQHGLGEKALSLFDCMQLKNLKPDKVMFVIILNVCTDLVNLDRGMKIHAQIIESGFESDLSVGSALVDMYAKCGSIIDAYQVFSKLQHRDVITWNAMVAGCVNEGYAKEALTLFEQMQQEGLKPDHVTFISLLKACGSLTASQYGKEIHAHIIRAGFGSDTFVQSTIVDMYAKCGSIEDAYNVFSKMDERDSISWSVMIAGFAQQGCIEEAFMLLKQMQLEGLKPDSVTFISILQACGNLAVLEWGKKIHAHMMRCSFVEDTSIGNTLIDMYVKCGSMKDAYKVFNEILERDLISWNVMITGNAQQGNGKEALILYDKMQQDLIEPDALTFVSILSACSHSGLVDDGCYHFKSMSQEHGITPTREHYTCMVDLLGRAGCLDEAQDIIVKMPFHSNMMVWITLLSACQSHGNVALGRCVSEYMLVLDQECPAAYVLMSNIFSGTGVGVT